TAPRVIGYAHNPAGRSAACGARGVAPEVLAMVVLLGRSKGDRGRSDVVVAVVPRLDAAVLTAQPIEVVAVDRLEEVLALLEVARRVVELCAQPPEHVGRAGLHVDLFLYLVA